MKNKETLLNMLSGLVLQIFTIISGFILPKIVLSFFGSEVNGLVSSLNQFLSYIALVEGGVTSVIIANLYKPLVEKDRKKLSSIMVTANKFYRKIGFIFIVYTLILASLYPIFFNINFGYLYVFSLTLILSVNLLIQYMFSLSLKTILNADKKGYIVNFTQSFIVVCNVIFALISVYIYPSIHVLKLISGALFIIQPLIFGKCVRDRYEIDWTAEVNNLLIKDRWNGFAINIAAFIHNSTDVTILTIFTNLKIVSVYSVYSLVSSGVKQLINACLTGIAHTVGQAYAKKDYEELNKKMDIYEYVVFILVFFLFTVSALLITPFVKIYTKGVTDANYNKPIFGILLIISEVLYLVKLPHLNLAYSANKFKEITKPAFIEALLNIIISLFFVKKFGLIGVTIGTIIGMTYRMMFHVYYTSKIVSGRIQSIFYKKIFLFTITAVVGFCICTFLIPITEITVLNWLVYAVIYSIIVGILLGIISITFFKKELKFFVRYLKR